MNFRFTIGRKIGFGFGILIFLTLLVFLVTNNTLNKSREIDNRINKVVNPTIELLETLKLNMVRSKMLINNWVFIQSRDDIPEKIQLRTLTSKEYPYIKNELLTLFEYWNEDEVGLANEIFEEINELHDLHVIIQEQLSSFESYDDPSVAFFTFPMIEEGGEVDVQTRKILGGLDRLINKHKSNSKQTRAQMIASYDTLQFLVRYLGIALFIGGILIALFTVRSIVRPILQLKRILLSLGKGVFPEKEMEVSNDEIGEMSIALNKLVVALKNTTEFSRQVGSGRFYEYDYKPLSDQDTLGHALLKMRDGLAENERMLEQKVEERTKEVVRQKEEIQKQRMRVEELYKDVTDSIRYAKRLQDSILPPAAKINRLLPDSFVLFKPKDIVSGDFYWLDFADEKVIFSAVDCTGHGVPGAFMSLVGHNGLNQAVNEHKFSTPSLILDDLNKIASESLNKTSEGNSVRDGMDMAICAIDFKNMKLEYAGANNPLYLFRGKEFIQVKADKMPIGGFAVGEFTYTNNEIDLQKGDVIYIFSDGYPDQFGGPKGKKFLYKRFKELLEEIKDIEMVKQKDILDQNLKEWMGGLEQVDDVCIIGVRIS
jgi:serine phosphatase RsbU (regulator of sigma subunit)/HAMP domain-containing protein